MRALLLTALITLVASCGCPLGVPPIYVESGSYRSTWNNGSPLTFAPAGNGGRTMIVDRNAGTVTVKYSSNNKQYVETWRIAQVQAPR